MIFPKMNGGRGWLVASAIMAVVAAEPRAAAAQSTGSAGCQAINGGQFDQAPLSGIGVTITDTLPFLTGEIITVTIVNATNSLAFVGFVDLFVGDTGTQTRMTTVQADEALQVGSDIQGAGSSIGWSCQPVAEDDGGDGGDDGGGGGDTGGNDNGGQPPNNAGAAQVRAAENAARNANENAQMPTMAAGLPTTLVVVTPMSERFKPRLASLFDARLNEHRAELIEAIGEAFEAPDDLGALPIEIRELRVRLAQSIVPLSELLQRPVVDPFVFASDLQKVVLLYIEVSGFQPKNKARLRLGRILDRLTDDVVEDIGYSPKSGADRRSIVRKGIIIFEEAAKENLKVQTERGDFGLDEGEQILFTPNGSNQITFAIDSDMLLDRDRLAAFGVNGVSVAANPRDFKFWARARITSLDGDRNGVDGEAGEVLFGAVQRLGDRFEIGAFGGVFTSDVTTNQLGMDVETDSFKVGLYANAALGDGIVAGLSGAYESGDVDTRRGAVTSAYDFDAFDLSASLTGAVLVEQWTLRPTVAATLSHRSDDAHRDSSGLLIAEEERTDGFLTGSLSVSRRFPVDDGMLVSFTPNFIVTGNAFLSDRGEVDAEHFDVTVGAGGTFAFTGGASLSLTGFIGGLAQDTQGYGGQLRFTLPF